MSKYFEEIRNALVQLESRSVERITDIDRVVNADGIIDNLTPSQQATMLLALHTTMNPLHDENIKLRITEEKNIEWSRGNEKIPVRGTIIELQQIERYLTNDWEEIGDHFVLFRNSTDIWERLSGVINPLLEGTEQVAEAIEVEKGMKPRDEIVVLNKGDHISPDELISQELRDKYDIQPYDTVMRRPPGIAVTKEGLAKVATAMGINIKALGRNGPAG